MPRRGATEDMCPFHGWSLVSCRGQCWVGAGVVVDVAVCAAPCLMGRRGVGGVERPWRQSDLSNLPKLPELHFLTHKMGTSTAPATQVFVRIKVGPGRWVCSLSPSPTRVGGSTCQAPVVRRTLRAPELVVRVRRPGQDKGGLAKRQRTELSSPRKGPGASGAGGPGQRPFRWTSGLS